MTALGWLAYVVGLRRLAVALAGRAQVEAWEAGGGLFD